LSQSSIYDLLQGIPITA